MPIEILSFQIVQIRNRSPERQYRSETALTEVKTRGYGTPNPNADLTGRPCGNCCTGVLEANLNSNVIGVAHIGWISRDPDADKQLKGRHAEYGRSVEDLTGVFSIEKFIQLWGNSTCGAISVDWLPCV